MSDTETPKATLRPRLAPRVAKEPEKVGSYFTNVKKKDIQFIHSGCTLLDCVLGGGWPLGRISNIVGDKSSGKTLMAIESCVNFNLQFPNGQIYYLETESAFDKSYAQALGMPVEAIEFVELETNTVEDFFDSLDDLIAEHRKSKEPGLYIVDSLDAMSDKAELERDIDQGSYAMGKQKKMSETFRRLTGDLEKTKIHLQIISQIRDKIGVTFGATKTRSGGKALDFYASQVLWLAEIKKHKRTVQGIERITGVEVKANCKKNKVGLPFRECDYPIYFGYGIDDITANLNFLSKTEYWDLIGELTDSKAKKADARTVNALVRKIKSSDKQERKNYRSVIDSAVVQAWQEIEERFMPESSKY